MKILALESASMAAGVALMEDRRLVGELRIHHQKTHSEQLLPMMDQLLSRCECPASQLDCLAVSVGPGSFTGIRIGVATVKGLALALSTPVVGLSTLETLAWQIPGFGGRIVPLMEAQKNLVYTAAYRFTPDQPQPLKEPDVLHIEEWLEALAMAGEPCLFTGDAMETHRQRIEKHLGSIAHFALPIHRMPSAAAVAQGAMARALRGDTMDGEALVPVYLRTSQAEKVFHQRKWLENRKKEGEQP